MWRWLTAAVAILAIAGAAGLGARAWRMRAGAIGPLTVTPVAASLSVRVGESVEFSASAPGDASYSWSLWGRVVSEGPAWVFVPGPEDAGWQQVVLVVGAGGARAERRWDVGVVPAVAPEVLDVSPPEGLVARTVGDAAELRVEARVAAARSADRLRFVWTVDGRPAREEERAASAGSSALDLPTEEPGTRHVVARVSEDDRVARLVEWTLDVAAPEPATPPPSTVPPSAPLAMREPARLVPTPGPRALERMLGEPLVLATRVQPEAGAVVYDWSVDGRRVQEGPSGRYEYVPTAEGRHRVAVTVLGPDGRTVGADAWTVSVLAPAPPSEPPPPAPSTTVPAPRPGTLADEEVRRWLEDYARAWSRKDMATLRRMGQVRTAEEADKLDRYFHSISDLHVEVRVIALRIEGERASVEFERTDTVTDPSGRRQELRLPPLRKEIERTPQGLRFTDRGPSG